MNYLKDKLSKALGWFGSVLFYIFALIYTLTPLLPLGFSWWLNAIIVIGMVFLPVIGGFAGIVFWIISFIKVIHMPFSAFTVVYYIVFAIYVIFQFLPSLGRILAGGSSRNR